MMAWLRLIRLPTVFTAMADIFLGFLLISNGQFEPTRDFVLLLAASSCLYLSGMVFNDVLDLAKDIQERPHRPIPSGAITLRGAWLLGLGLIAAGLVCAYLVGATSVAVAGAIVVAVFAYDWLLKKTPLAPIAMGSCRFLNVMLGASTVANSGELFGGPHVWVATCLGIYIAGLTWFARKEAVGDNRKDLIGGSVVMIAAIVGLIAVVFRMTEPSRNTTQVLILLGFMCVVIGSRLRRAVRSGLPIDIGSGIRTALLSLVLIDASLVLAFTQALPGAIATAALLIPASIIRRWIPLT